jgi:hypothetical protein
VEFISSKLMAKSYIRILNRLSYFTLGVWVLKSNKNGISIIGSGDKTPTVFFANYLGFIGIRNNYNTSKL